MIDRFANKFKAVQNLGENIDLYVGEYSLAEKSFHWFRYPHDLVDGIGAIIVSLETRLGLKAVSQPVAREPHPPSLFRRAKLSIDFGKEVAANNMRWKTSIDFSKVGAPDLIACYFFSAKDSALIKDAAKKNGFTLTSLFVSALDQVTKDKFLILPSERKWVIPITLRGAVGKKPVDLRNVTASIILRLENESDPKTVHDKMRSFLKRQLHWGSWFQNTVQSFLSESITTKLASKYVNGAYGLFSNLGPWPASYFGGIQPNADRTWAFLPPVVRMTPVTASVFEWNDRIQLSFGLHPCLNIEETEFKSIFKEWIACATQTTLNRGPESLEHLHWLSTKKLQQETEK